LAASVLLAATLTGLLPALPFSLSRLALALLAGLAARVPSTHLRLLLCEAPEGNPEGTAGFEHVLEKQKTKVER
jgi:hypothetical protein